MAKHTAILDFKSKHYLGGKVTKFETYSEGGYSEHTKDRVNLMGLRGSDIEYPESTCFIVVEK